MRKLRRYVADAHPVMADWRCSGCANNYREERYCLSWGPGDFSHMPEEVTLRADDLSLYS
uniref:hypothetical protein n=1 Tax=Tenebrionibacter/Tenebrionicola group TaxID=2969848 RepID=UPI0037D9C788